MEETLRQGGFAMDDEIPVDLMEELSAAERDPEEIDRPSISYWNMCWLRLKKDKLAMFGFAVIIVITALAIAVPMLSPYSYDQTDFAHMLEWPSRLHPFGTDKMGRDIFVRTMYGARISLTIGFTAAAINMVIGVFYGGIAGYLGGRTDMIMMRIVDVLSGIPSLLYLILIMMFLGNTVKSVPYLLDHHGPHGPRTDSDSAGAGFCAGSQGLRAEPVADSDSPSDSQQYGVHHRDGDIFDSPGHFPGGVFELSGDRYPGAEGQLGNAGQRCHRISVFLSVSDAVPRLCHQHHHLCAEFHRRRPAGCAGSQTEEIEQRYRT